MEDEKLIIPQGVTFQGGLSTFGLILGVIGLIILFAGAYIVGALIVIIGIQLFLSIRGVMIDYAQKRIKAYLFLFGRLGSWKDISGHKYFKIKRFAGGETRPFIAASTTTFTRYSDLYLVNESGGDEVLIHSCNTKEYAQELRDEIAKNLGIKIEDNSL